MCRCYCSPRSVERTYPELFSLPGYKPLIFKSRQGMRGGGVGFYVKEHLNVQILEELSLF